MGNQRPDLQTDRQTDRSQLVEGKYFSSQRGAKQHQDLGKMVGLMLIMYKHIYGSVNSVVFDSGFCVAKGVV